MSLNLETLLERKKMLTQMEKNLLMKAASSAKADRIEAINDVISLLRLQNPKSFYKDDEDRRLLTRVFFDEPVELHPTKYSHYVVPSAGVKRADLFKMRSLVLLRK